MSSFRSRRRLELIDPCVRFSVELADVGALRSTRGYPPGHEPNIPAGHTADLLALNRWWLRQFWRADSERLRRRRRQRDRLAAPAETGQRRGRVRGRRGGSRLKSRQWAPQRGSADAGYPEQVDPA